MPKPASEYVPTHESPPIRCWRSELVVSFPVELSDTDVGLPETMRVSYDRLFSVGVRLACLDGRATICDFLTEGLIESGTCQPHMDTLLIN